MASSTPERDDARGVLSDPRAPADERFDAQAELMRDHRPLASQLIPTQQLQPVIDYINDGLQQAAMLKAQAVMDGRRRAPATRGMQSVYLDDMQIQASGEFWEKPAALDFGGLRDMVEKTPILSAVVNTRVRQVQRFCAPSEDGGLGFEIRHRDKKHQQTPSDDENNALLARFFSSCGWEFNPRERKKLKRDAFGNFMAKSVRDTLAMDSAPIETEMKRDSNLGIDGMYAVDGTTIRLCTDEGYEGDDEIFAVQVVQGRVATVYSHDQLIYEPRNPRAGVHVAGYGYGETEQLIKAVTGILMAWDHNQAGFDRNAIPKGLLQITGEYGPEDMAAFRRQWTSMVKGMGGQWSLPVLFSKDAEGKATFEKFGIEHDEMLFSKWMTFLTSIICAIYGMTPDEINFESFAASKSSLSGSDTAEKLADSKDKGLRPLLAYYEQLFSDYVVSSFNTDLVFRWVGLDQEDAAMAWEAKKLTATLNEIRAQNGEPAFPDPVLGDAPVNPQLLNAWMQLNHAPPPPAGPPGTDFGGQGEGADYGDEAAGGAAPGEPGGEGQGDGAPGGGPPVDPGGEFGGGEGDFGKALTASAAIYSVR